MRKPVSITGEEATAIIADNVAVATIGTTLVLAAETILKAIEQRFLEARSPRGLTPVHSCGQNDRDRGIQHFARETILSRTIGGHWGPRPRMMQLIAGNKILVYCIPQGQFVQLYRSMTGGEPGKITKMGLGTFIDPRIDGDKMNEIIISAPDISEVVIIGDEECMRHKPIPLDYCIIRGTYVDGYGNLTTDKETMQSEVFSVVMACKKFGDEVLAQAKYKVKVGSLRCKRVIVPGVFIDAVVTRPNPEGDHRQTRSFYMDPVYCGDTKALASSDDVLPISLRKVIGRRALMELAPDDVLNVGTGIPNDVVGPIIMEEGMLEDVIIIVESGIYGGIPMDGIDFGIAKNQSALARYDDQSDYYNGPGVDVTYMGAGEVDAQGNVNAMCLGLKPTGAGGFIDITINAKHVVFCSSFTAKGLDCFFEGGRLHINQEDSLIKFVNQIKQVPYNGKIAREKDQKMHYVTERAAFELQAEGLTLTETVPGIDIQAQTLDLMELTPRAGSELKETDVAISMEGAPFGLRRYIFSNWYATVQDGFFGQEESLSRIASITYSY